MPNYVHILLRNFLMVLVVVALALRNRACEEERYSTKIFIKNVIIKSPGLRLYLMFALRIRNSKALEEYLNKHPKTVVAVLKENYPGLLDYAE